MTVDVFSPFTISHYLKSNLVGRAENRVQNVAMASYTNSLSRFSNQISRIGVNTFRLDKVINQFQAMVIAE